MDLATIIGLVGGIGVIMMVMILDGGSPAELFHVAPMLLTIGGALMATMISFPLSATLAVPKWFIICFKGVKVHPHGAIDILTKMADKARREGLLALEEESKKLDDEFLRKGLMMVVDGVDPSQVRTILEIDIKQMEERHAVGINYFSAAGGYGPTMGIIGTVMGLISVLKELDNPGALGPAIASAFLATLWGILTANVTWMPLAGKLRLNSEEEVTYRKLLLEGVLALQAGENPRIVKDKLNAFLPPKQRQTEEGAAGGAKAKGAA